MSYLRVITNFSNQQKWSKGPGKELFHTSVVLSYLKPSIISLKGLSPRTHVFFPPLTITFLLRSLLARGFARFGKWFTQPLSNNPTEKRPNEPAACQLSFSFKFFVHGDSTICTSLDVRQHSAVCRLNKSHITAAQSSQNGLKVILGPYGLSGCLTGQTFKDGDPSVSKVLADWKRFYPLNSKDTSTQTSVPRFDGSGPEMCGLSSMQASGSFPAIVEVVVAGTKMKYPSCYAFVPLEANVTVPRSHNNCKEVIPKTQCESAVDTVLKKVPTPRLSPYSCSDPSAGFTLRCGSVQDIGSTLVQGAKAITNQDNLFWEIVDTSSRVVCPNSRCKSARKSGVVAAKSGSLKVPNKADVKPAKKQPFHKRNASESITEENDLKSSQQLGNGVSKPVLPTKSPGVGVPSNATTPGCIDSPRSAAAASEEPGSAMGLSSVSPFPSVKNVESVPPPDSVPKSQPPHEQLQQQQSSPSRLETANSDPSQSEESILKRPILKDCPEDIVERRPTSSALLYDLSAVTPSLAAWDINPPKRRRLMTPFSGLDSSCGDGSLVSKPIDPYEFSDEELGLIKLESNSNVTEVIASVKDSPATIAKNEIGTAEQYQTFLVPEMQPSMTDLDNMFETSSGDDSNDGMSTARQIRPAVAPLTGLELSRMFPTPPSLEPAVPSPSTTAVENSLLEIPCSPAALESLKVRTFFKSLICVSSDLSATFFRDQGSKSVYEPLVICRHPSAVRYNPLDIPTIPPLPSDCIYKRLDANLNGNANQSGIVRQMNLKGYRLVSSHPAGQVSKCGSRGSLPSRSNNSPFGRFSPPRAHQPNGPPSLSSEDSFRMRTVATTTGVMGKTMSDVEISSILLNLVLSDSMLNLHKDHNFESCTVCVCNSNIKGADAGVFLPDALVPGIEEPQYKCTCGFSAVINRSRSQFAGLFYEDEVDITGLFYDPLEGKAKTTLMLDLKRTNSSTNFIDLLIDLLRSQSTYIMSSSSIFSRSDLRVLHQLPQVRDVFKTDACQIVYLALKSGKMALDSYQKLNLEYPEHRIARHTLHEWQFNLTDVPYNNQGVVKFLRILQPILQESVQKKPKASAMWEVTYSVSGPLTWRQFHRLAGRGTDDQCEPQPIPSLLVGHNKDWSVLSPFALKYWDNLSLEPYSRHRNVSYLVLSPDPPHLNSQIKSYFRELSCVYETLRLGKHTAVNEIVRDGIVKVGKSYAAKLASEEVDDWFDHISDPTIMSRLKTYAQVCKSYLVNIIMKHVSEKSKTGDHQSNNSSRGAVGSPANSDSANNIDGSKGDDPISSEATSSAGSHLAGNTYDGEEEKQPAIVVYIVEPFTFSSLDETTYRLACMGLLRCFSLIFRGLPDIQNNLHLQIVSLESICSMTTDERECNRQDQLRSMAFSVFGQCRKTLTPVPISKSLTGFGPAASINQFLKKQHDAGALDHCRRFFSPPFVLAPLKDKNTELGEMFGDGKERSQTLFCCYCLSEDQKWIIVSASNDRGDILESTVIKIEVINRMRRKRASVKKFGLNKVMEFIIAVISESLDPWRLVIGRLGRVGHGELKEWASLLSKKALLKATARLREKCEQCKTLSYYEQPSILSACLISLEPDSALRVFPDQFTSEDKFSATCPLNTPQDASSTHLLIFPTSATTSSSQGNFQNDAPNLGEDDLLSALGGGDDGDLGVDDGMGDLFNWTDDPPSPGLGLGSPRHHGMAHTDSPESRQAGFDGLSSSKVCFLQRIHFI